MFQKKYLFILYHLIIILIIYYFIFLVLDLLLKGIASRFFPISFLLIGALTLASVLALLSKKSSAKKFSGSQKLVKILLIVVALLIFVALMPHGIVNALVAALVIPLVFFINRDCILK
jgi:hypothetical protein